MNSHVFRPLTPDDINPWIDYINRNRNFLSPFEPLRMEYWYERDYQSNWLNHIQVNDHEAHYGLFSHEGNMLGKVSLSNISGGPFQNANIGYSVDFEEARNGYGTLLVQHILEEAFLTYDLHRVQAAVMPSNTPSIGLLQKFGFRFEGFAERYLCINGKWEDHSLFALTREETTFAKSDIR